MPLLLTLKTELIATLTYSLISKPVLPAYSIVTIGPGAPFDILILIDLYILFEPFILGVYVVIDELPDKGVCELLITLPVGAFEVDDLAIIDLRLDHAYDACCAILVIILTRQGSSLFHLIRSITYLTGEPGYTIIHLFMNR